MRVKTADSDGYEAVQLAFDAVAERKISKPRLGHLGEGRVRTATSSSSAAPPSSPSASRHRRGFEPGDTVKVAGIGIGKGFAGTIKRHNFHRGPVSHGSHNIRTPGSIGASATPSRVFKGIKMAGRMGGKRVTQVGLTVHEVDAGAEPAARQGRRPRPEERHRRDQGGQRPWPRRRHL